MDESTKRAIKKTILALRKLLEKEDIPTVLKQHGIFLDGRRVPLEKLAVLDDKGRERRERLEAGIKREVHAVGGDQKRGIERYCREVSFTYLNRFVALRCMEVRGLIDECIKIRGDYAGRSLRHHRFLREHPGKQFDSEDTDSLKAFLRSVFRELQDDIRILFDPDDEYSIIMPSLQALRECLRALNEDIPEDAFRAPELLGWVYQYFQTEEKDRVFEEVRTKKKKIEGDDIVPATSLYTERYMVDYLVQNSLGAIWMEMYPDSKLCENWQYFVKDQDLKPRKPRPVTSLTFLDPACGSGHFLLVAFDLLVQMYEEEARLATEGKIPKEWVVPKEKIANTIVESNLHGIDIDLRSVQLSYLVLYLRMREHQRLAGAAKSLPEKVNLVAADASLLNTPEFLSWCEERFQEEPYALNIITGIVGRLRNFSEIGSLARPEEDLKELIHREKERLLSSWNKEKTPQQALLFREMLTSEQQELPFEKITDDQFWEGVLSQVAKALDEYYQESTERGDTRTQVFAHEASRGFKFLELSNKRYDVVATNPPYMGSKNMAKDLKEYVSEAYPEGKNDLYTSFILRCCALASNNGRMAIVTRSQWMALSMFRKLREKLMEYRYNLIADLGSNAFSEMLHAGVRSALLVLTPSARHKDDNLLVLETLALSEPDLKARNLARMASEVLGDGKYKVEIDLIDILPDKIIAYSLPNEFISLLASRSTLSKIASVKAGLQTSNNDRFVRYFWEVPTKSVVFWRKYAKGGGYKRWAGFNWFRVYWKDNGSAIKQFTGSYVRNEGIYFKPLVGYNSFCNGHIAGRFLDNSIFDLRTPAIECRGISRASVAALLCSRVTEFVLRRTSPTIEYHEGYVNSLPIPAGFELDKDVMNLGSICIALATVEVEGNSTESDFSGLESPKKRGDTLLRLFLDRANNYIDPICAGRLASEGLLEKKIMNLYQLSPQTQSKIINDLGVPTGWHRIINGYDAIPTIDVCETTELTIELLENNESFSPTNEELSKIKSCIRALYETGPGAKIEDLNGEGTATNWNDEEEAESPVDKRIPIPTETFLEELSVNMEIHPISIYWLLKEMREKEGLVCWHYCKRYVEDYFNVMILRMLASGGPNR